MHIFPQSPAFDNRSIQSKTIDYLRFPMAIMVIFIHQNPDLKYGSNDLSDLIYNIITCAGSLVVPRIAVPMFFFISGFLFFYKVPKFDKHEYFTKLKKRYKSLVLPYIYWNILAFVIGALVLCKDINHNLADSASLYDYIRNFSFRMFWDYNSWGDNWCCFGLFHASQSTGPLDLPLWFLRNLIILTVLTPIIYYMVKKIGKLFIFILAFCYLSIIWIDFSPLNITGIFYFSLGCHVSINKLDIIDTLGKWKKYIYAFTILMVIACIYLKITYHPRIFFSLINLFILPGVISVYCLMYQLIKSGIYRYQWPVLAKSSFFVYALHSIYILGFVKFFVNKYISMCFGFYPTLGEIATYLTTPFITSAICLLLFIVMRKFTPNLLSALTGNR